MVVEFSNCKFQLLFHKRPLFFHLHPACYLVWFTGKWCTSYANSKQRQKNIILLFYFCLFYSWKNGWKPLTNSPVFGTQSFSSQILLNMHLPSSGVWFISIMSRDFMNPDADIFTQHIFSWISLSLVLFCMRFVLNHICILKTQSV